MERAHKARRHKARQGDAAGGGVRASRVWRLALIGLPGVALAVAALPGSAQAASGSGTPGVGSAQGQLSSLRNVVVGSAVAPNGDQNPYGIAVVPKTIGKLTAGNLLVADFNDAAGTAGAGTTIVQVDPSTGQSSVFFQGGPVAGPVGIAINPLNDGVWVGDYGAAANGTGANDLLINPAGTLVATFTDTTTEGQASFLGVWGQGVSDVNGVISFYWGNAGNATTGTGGGDVWRLTPHPTASTPNGQPVNSTYQQLVTGQPATPAGGSAASAAGPQGLAYDPANGVLYETNDANNALYAIPDAASATGPVTASVVYQGPALDSPENVVVDPVNGNLLVVNGAGNNDLVEITPSGQVVAVRDLAPNEAPGALFGLAVGSGPNGQPVLYYGDDDTNTIHMLVPPAPGYWEADAHGGVFSFGDAQFFGSLPGAGIRPAAPVVGIVPTPDDQGYWLVGSDGGVYAFGDAQFFGSLPGLPAAVQPHSPVVGLAATVDGRGYWEVTSAGDVYAFGDAQFFGSLPGAGIRPAAPVVGIVPTPDDQGYWLVGSDGGVFSFGDASYLGSVPGAGLHLRSSVVGLAAG
jgi:hypothetical protein